MQVNAQIFSVFYYVSNELRVGSFIQYMCLKQARVPRMRPDHELFLTTDDKSSLRIYVLLKYFSSIHSK